jgi:hypothetical protein
MDGMLAGTAGCGTGKVAARFAPTVERFNGAADGRKRRGDGARYRVRTCDPYRVKVVLYH